MANPKKGVAYTFDIGLINQSNRPFFKANPTLAAGDFKISKDGGAFTNLANLPTVTPAAGVLVNISLTSAEMNADRLAIVASDAAGSEWDDVLININTAAVTVDELVRSATPANALSVDSSGRVAIQFNVKKNTARANFPFLMTDSTTHAPKTGVSVTATRSIDGGGYGACTNAVVEVANGSYKIDLSAADLNGDTIMLRFTGAGSDDVLIQVVTVP